MLLWLHALGLLWPAPLGAPTPPVPGAEYTDGNAVLAPTLRGGVALVLLNASNASGVTAQDGNTSAALTRTGTVVARVTQGGNTAAPVVGEGAQAAPPTATGRIAVVAGEEPPLPD